jgi:hypothetical protein
MEIDPVPELVLVRTLGDGKCPKNKKRKTSNPKCYISSSERLESKQVLYVIV